MDYSTVNDYLTSIFNNVPSDQSKFAGSSFKDISIKRNALIDVIGIQRVTPSQVSQELMVTHRDWQ